MTNLSELSTEELLRALPDEDLRRLAQQPEAPGVVSDMLRSAPGAIMRGAAGIAGLPGMVSRLGEQAFDATVGRAFDYMTGAPRGTAERMREAGPNITRHLTPSGIIGGIEAAAGGPMYRAQTTPGRISESAVEWGTGAALGPLRALPTAIGLGAAGGAASQGLDEYLRSTGLPDDSWQRRFLPPAAGIATTVGLGIPLARRGAPGDIVEQRLQGAADDPAALAAARERLTTGQQVGVPLTPAEALGDQGAALQQLTGNVAASPQGGQLAAALRGRQNQVTNAVRGPGGFLERVSPDASPAVPMAARSAATSPLYQRAATESIDPAGLGAQNVLSGVVPQVRDRMVEAGANNPLGRQYGRYMENLTTPEAGEQTMRVGPLQTLYQNTRDNILPAPEAMAGADRAALGARLSGGLGPANQALGQRLEELNPTFAQAQQTFRDMSPRVNAAGIREGFDQIYERALQSGTTRANNPTVGAQLAQALRGREGGLRANEFEEAIRVAARGTGRNEDAAVREANRLMDALAQTARIPGVGSETAPRQALTTEARRSVVAALMSLPRDLVGSGTLSNLARDVTERGTYGRLSQALMPGGPETLDNLLALAGRGVPSRQGAIAARALTLSEAPGRIQERRR